MSDEDRKREYEAIERLIAAEQKLADAHTALIQADAEHDEAGSARLPRRPMPARIASLSPAVADLGLGGMLGEQVSDETEEQRKKRMQQIQLNQTMGPQQSLAAKRFLAMLATELEKKLAFDLRASWQVRTLVEAKGTNFAVVMSVLAHNFRTRCPS
jgi:hypothetical protein